jgi:large subunit ribosomal protein L6
MKIPEGVNVEVADGIIKVSGKTGTLERKFDSRNIAITVEDGEIVFKISGRKDRSSSSLEKTLEAHVRNMMKGVQGDFEKKLQVVFAHFPISIEQKGKEILIKNFLGEKTPRVAKVQGAAKVKVNGQELVVSGNDREDVGQTASNIVRATKIVKRDNRVFQDGIYYE